MSTHLVKVMVPPLVAMPRGAAGAAHLSVMLLRLGSRAWRALEAVGHARARRELLRLSARHADRPDFARQLRQAAHRAAMQRD